VAALDLTVIPIGTVREIGEGRSLLEVMPAYRAGLQGVEPGSHVQVLYWMHELTPSDRRVLRTHPRGDRDKPRRGVFSLRSPSRPNPIGVSDVEVVAVDDAGVIVAGLDARDGSPIIDIKAGHR
jgi:tRNA-Thr(GGU) m(6)t(6)A37 methyltransferase TsaA